MKFVRKQLLHLTLTAAMVVPFAMATVAAVAQNDHQDERNEQRYYDRTHKDYHRWDDHEARAYRRYLRERRRHYRVYSRLSRERQEEYWNWRHDHPDEDRR